MSREACMSTPEQIAAEDRFNEAREAVMEWGCPCYWRKALLAEPKTLCKILFAGMGRLALAAAEYELALRTENHTTRNDVLDGWLDDLDDCLRDKNAAVLDAFEDFRNVLARKLIDEHWGD